MTTIEPHRVAPVAEVRKNFGDVIARAAYGGERTIITRHGRPAAAIISAADLEYFERLEDAEDVRAYDAAKANDDGARFSLAEIDRMVEQDSEGD